MAPLWPPVHPKKSEITRPSRRSISAVCWTGKIPMLLQIDRIHTYYEDSHVLDGVSLEIAEGQTVAILGRNGVGKSTTLKSIMGLVPPQRGTVLFKNEELVGMEPFRIARKGIGYVPEERRIFPGLTVRENLIMGLKKGIGKDVRSKASIEKIYSRLPQLAARDATLGGNLSGGEQQILTLARTLIGEPNLVLIDEPTEGLSPIVAELIFDIIREIRAQGISVILIDRNLTETCGMADRVYIMVKGMIAHTGTGQEVLENEEIQHRYLAV
ncbi:MAG: ABC transporter ATP-binding protein [Deltaproteobacteria bacterium]|nr:ABC transporter ATP-binding protein [Deltaproteobacteria bacterium]